MNKIEFSKLKNKEDMILAFNQLKDDYRQLFAINEDLQEEIIKLKSQNKLLSAENSYYKHIINELEKEFEWQLKKQIDIDKFAEEQGFLNYNPVKLMVEHFNNKLKELKENNK